jgi:hypothetical protein
MEREPSTIHFTFPRYIDITYFSVGYDLESTHWHNFLSSVLHHVS